MASNKENQLVEEKEPYVKSQTQKLEDLWDTGMGWKNSY